MAMVGLGVPDRGFGDLSGGGHGLANSPVASQLDLGGIYDRFPGVAVAFGALDSPCE